MAYCPNVDDRVLIIREAPYSDLTGRVIGFGHQILPLRNSLVVPPQPVVLVEIDHGFYGPDGGTFVSVLPVHADNLCPAA